MSVLCVRVGCVLCECESESECSESVRDYESKSEFESTNACDG